MHATARGGRAAIALGRSQSHGVRRQSLQQSLDPPSAAKGSPSQRAAALSRALAKQGPSQRCQPFSAKTLSTNGVAEGSQSFEVPELPRYGVPSASPQPAWKDLRDVAPQAGAAAPGSMQRSASVPASGGLHSNGGPAPRGLASPDSKALPVRRRQVTVEAVRPLRHVQRVLASQSAPASAEASPAHGEDLPGFGARQRTEGVEDAHPRGAVGGPPRRARSWLAQQKAEGAKGGLRLTRPPLVPSPEAGKHGGSQHEDAPSSHHSVHSPGSQGGHHEGPQLLFVAPSKEKIVEFRSQEGSDSAVSSRRSSKASIMIGAPKVNHPPPSPERPVVRIVAPEGDDAPAPSPTPSPQPAHQAWEPLTRPSSAPPASALRPRGSLIGEPKNIPGLAAALAAHEAAHGGPGGVEQGAAAQRPAAGAHVDPSDRRMSRRSIAPDALHIAAPRKSVFGIGERVDATAWNTVVQKQTLSAHYAYVVGDLHGRKAKQDEEKKEFDLQLFRMLNGALPGEEPCSPRPLSTPPMRTAFTDRCVRLREGAGGRATLFSEGAQLESDPGTGHEAGCKCPTCAPFSLRPAGQPTPRTWNNKFLGVEIRDAMASSPSSARSGRGRQCTPRHLTSGIFEASHNGSRNLSGEEVELCFIKELGRRLKAGQVRTLSEDASRAAGGFNRSVFEDTRKKVRDFEAVDPYERTSVAQAMAPLPTDPPPPNLLAVHWWKPKEPAAAEGKGGKAAKPPSDIVPVPDLTKCAWSKVEEAKAENKEEALWHFRSRAQEAPDGPVPVKSTCKKGEGLREFSEEQQRLAVYWNQPLLRYDLLAADPNSLRPLRCRSLPPNTSNRNPLLLDQERPAKARPQLMNANCGLSVKQVTDHEALAADAVRERGERMQTEKHFAELCAHVAHEKKEKAQEASSMKRNYLATSSEMTMSLRWDG